MILKYMVKLINNYFSFIIIFILLEIKKSLNLFIKINKIKLEYNLVNFLRYKFLNKDLKFKDDKINLFLKKNSIITKDENIKTESKNKILIELLLPHHSEPMLFNCLIGKDLQKYYNAEIIGLINKNDYLTKRIAESFGIKKFIYICECNFIKRIYYFILALKFIKINDVEKKIINLKFLGHEVGKAALENYLRWHNKMTSPLKKFLLYLFLSKALSITEFGNRLFKTKYKIFVMGELQFLPNKLLFHSSLKSKIPVYSWFGTSSINFIGRMYKKYDSRNSPQLKISIKLSRLLYKILKQKNIIKELKKLDGIKNIGKETIWSDKKKFRTINFLKKEDFYNHFNFDLKKKIILILPHAMSDNLFNNEWNIFNTSYEWFFETLKEIKILNNLNWLIKPHPYEYKFTGITARNIYESLNIKNINIKFLNEDVHINQIYRFIDGVITGNGSAGYQYASLGIPTITTSDANYSNFKFTIAPKNKSEYFNLLKNINKLSKIRNDAVKKAQVYWLSNLKLIYNHHKILPKIEQHGKFKKKIFFSKITKNNLERFKKNFFSDDIKYQLDNNNRHSINSFFLKRYKKRYNFKLGDV